MPQFRIEYRPATENEEKFVISSLKKHTSDVKGVNTKDEPFSVLVFNSDELVGAVIGKTFWNWLYADLVWVAEKCRGSRIGTDIMAKTEEKARMMGLTGIYLWTETWQAPAFYSKLGYENYVVFNDFPPGHKRLGFRKYLSHGSL
jgi:GNAT superfamily N-acetyltransferase